VGLIERVRPLKMYYSIRKKGGDEKEYANEVTINMQCEEYAPVFFLT
jgi:hypothetical protein